MTTFPKLKTNAVAQYPLGRRVVFQNQSLTFVDGTQQRYRDGASALGLDVREWMSKRVVSCRSSDRVDAVLGTMTNLRVRHVPVIDDGELKGIVSIGDLVKYRLDEKEMETSVLLDMSRMRSARR